MKGYLIRYKYRGAEPSPSYTYQRFFRALYGYTQVVKKSTGRTYIYYRDGVLTLYPYIRESKNVIIVPDNALEPLITFFKTGKNPAHVFEDLSTWNVVYYIEETSVEEERALQAIHDALNRIIVRTESFVGRLSDLLSRKLTADDYAAIKYRARHVVESSWFRELYEKDPLLTELNDAYAKAQTLL